MTHIEGYISTIPVLMREMDAGVKYFKGRRKIHHKVTLHTRKGGGAGSLSCLRDIRAFVVILFLSRSRRGQFDVALLVAVSINQQRLGVAVNNILGNHHFLNTDHGGEVKHGLQQDRFHN